MKILAFVDLYPNFWVLSLNQNTVRKCYVCVCVCIGSCERLAESNFLRNNIIIGAKNVHVLVIFFILNIFDLNCYFDLWRICSDMVGSCSCSCSRALQILQINCARVHSLYNITKQAIDCVVCVCDFFFRIFGTTISVFINLS